MFLKTATLIVAVLGGGCFAELAGGVTPRFTQEITDANNATTTNKGVGWSVAFVLGFHLDYKIVGVGYSPVNAMTTKAEAGSPDVISAGHHVRVDVDLPLSQKIRTRAVGAYTTVTNVTLDATGNTTAAPMDFPNGKVKVEEAKGQTVFLGLAASTKPTYDGRQSSLALGLSYQSSTNIAGMDLTKSVPAVEASGLGAQLRFMVAWSPDVSFFGRMSRAEWRELAAASARAPSTSTKESPFNPGPDSKSNCTKRTKLDCEYGQFGKRCVERTVCD
jgi:hypothetical protein